MTSLRRLLTHRCRGVLMKYCWLEPILFIALLSAVIWLVPPAVVRHLPPPLVVLVITIGLIALPLWSTIRHRDRPREIGLRVDNLLHSSREVILMTVGTTIVVMTIGWACDWPLRFPTGSALAVLAYSPWGLVQQFVLQAFVYRRLRQSLGQPVLVAAVSAMLFSVIHLPNPVLVATTAIAGYCWCRMYERTPNLFTLALSHAWLAILVMAQVPDAIHHSMRVGPRFWM